jgi:MFS family permease
MENSGDRTAIVAQDSWKGWTVAGASFIGLLFSVGVLVVYSFGVLSSSMAQSFGWSNLQRSVLFVSFSLSSTIAGPIWGMVADRVGPRKVVIISSILLAACFCGLAAIPNNLLVAHLMFALIGLLGSGTLPPMYASLVVGWFNRFRGLALGTAMVGVGIGAAVLPPIAAKIITVWGWRETCIAYGMAVLLFSLPCAIVFLRSYSEQSTTSKSDDRSNRVTFAAVSSQYQTWILAIFAVVTGAILVACVTNFVPLLQSRGETLTSAAKYQAILGISLVAGRFIGGALLDRVFAPRVVTVILITTALGLLLLAQASTPTAYTLAAIGIGLSIGIEIDFLGYIVSRYYDRASFTTIFASFFALYSIGATAGPPLFSWVMQVAGSYVPGLLGSSALMFVLGMSLFMLPRYEPKA